MPDLDQEHAHLALADRHLAEGERRVADQSALIRRMSGQGHDTAMAREFLKVLEQTLEQWRIHRQLILDAIARG